MPDKKTIRGPFPDLEDPHRQNPLAMARTLAFDEPTFMRWYQGQAARAGIDPNPDNPEHHYDYRAAYRAGVTPEIDPEDGRYHWDSRFKADDHPRRFLPLGAGGAMIDTRTDEPMKAAALNALNRR